MTGFGWILESIPGGVFAVVGAASGLAFLAGPLVLVTLASRGWTGGLRHFSARLPAATLLSLLSVTAASVTGTASLVHVFFGIATTGRSGAGMVAEAGLAADRAVLSGLVTLAACGLVVAAVTLRSAVGERRIPVAERAPMSLWRALALSVLLGLAILGVDRLLRVHHELMNVTLTLIDPASSGGGTVETSAVTTERNSSLLILGGGLITLALLVAGLATWHGSQARRPHRVLVWASTVALVIVVIGAAWHARLASVSLEAFRDVTRRGQAALVSPGVHAQPVTTGGPSNTAMKPTPLESMKQRGLSPRR